MVNTQGLLKKAKVTVSSIALEDLVPWSSLKGINSFRDGPKKAERKTSLSWPSILKVFLEV